ncbi:MAG: YegS/Rv2252/BmrU family lipid kinase [Paludibacter sp.]|nr:YegS/Rv2252/BmrU family lipid kinase [Paludibacter sp.]
MSKQKIAFIINPISGKKTKKFVCKTVEENLNSEKFECVFAHTEYGGHGQQLAQEFVNQDFNIIVAVGGDGTVNEIAQVLAHTSTALGIIPTGSGNGLARYLNIPKNLIQAVQYINTATIVDADYGLLNEQFFLCTCGAGFDALVSSDFANDTVRGFSGYLAAILRQFFACKPEHYQLVSKDFNLDISAFMINFANISQWGYNAYIAPNADIHDGEMEITILKKFPVWAAPRIAAQLFLKNISKNRYVNTFTTNEVTVIRNQHGWFQFDGEPCRMPKETKIRIIRNGIKILAKS